jgi:hypothetical protein
VFCCAQTLTSVSERITASRDKFTRNYEGSTANRKRFMTNHETCATKREKFRDEIENDRDKICAQQNTRVFNFQCAELSFMLESECRFILVNRCSVRPDHYAGMSPDL